MGYQIVYENVGKFPQPQRKKRTGIFATVIVILLVLCAITIKTVGLQWVQEVLLPGDPDVTAAALENMVSDLRDGEGIVEAFKAFCEEIMQNGISE